MDKNRLKEIPISSFNEEGWLKPPLSIHANLAILAKGLLIFIMSLASMGKSEQLLSIIFPEKQYLYVAIALSIIPLFTLVLFSIGNTQDNLKLKKAGLAICILQIIVEFVVLLGLTINAFKPFESVYFYILLGYLLIIFLTTTSYETKLFVNQIFKGQGVIEKQKEEAA